MSCDRSEWKGCWDVSGIGSDDGRPLSVCVGVIDLDGRHTIAISVGDTPPVALTDHMADEMAELVGWAKEERDMLADLRERQRSAELKDSLNRALLTQRQWHTIREALHHANTSGHGSAALNMLNDAAPTNWTS